MFTKYVNVLIYLCAIFAMLATSACGAVANGAMYVEPTVPEIAKGSLLALQNACTYYWANQVMLNTIPHEVIISPSGGQAILRWVVSGWPHLQGILLVNLRETTAAYWQNLSGMVGNGEDVQALVDKAKMMGWTTTSIKDIGLTTFASHVASVVAQVGAMGETLLFGVTLTTDDLWQSIVFENDEDL